MFTCGISERKMFGTPITSDSYNVNRDPRVILTNNDLNYTNFVPKIYPPEEDEDEDEDEKGEFYDYDNGLGTTVSKPTESMNYKAYYGQPPYGGNHHHQVFAPLDSKGYANSNISFSGGDQTGVWKENDSDELDVNKSTGAGNGGVSSTFTATELDNNIKRKGINATTTTTTTSKKNGVDGGGGDWTMSNVDPFGGGRSFLLRELKSKFLELSTPLTRFVTRYCALSGMTDSTRALHHFIQIRSLFNKAEENNDWEGLVNLLYGNNSNTNTNNDNNGGGGLDTSELADAILKMISEEETLKAKSRKGTEDTESIQRQQMQMLLKRNANVKNRTATMLRNGYNNLVSGKVVFLLDPILRESAQSLLDIINENYRGSYQKPNFTLLEIMKSDSVMTTFIKLMLISKQTGNMLGVIPITPNNTLSGMYGTLGDRVTSNSANYQNRTYGDGANSSLTIVQSRPSVANMVAGSMEYNAGMTYFANVEKAKDGSGGLIYVNPSKRNSNYDIEYEKLKKKYKSERERNGMSYYYDNSSRFYRRRLRDDYDDDDDSDYYYSDNNKPIETLQSALDRNAYENEPPSGKYNSKVLSYKNMNGHLKLVSKSILSDVRALTTFYNTGNVGYYGIDSY